MTRFNISLDSEVVRLIRERGLPNESPNATLRRTFGLAPPPKKGWPKGKSRKKAAVK